MTPLSDFDFVSLWEQGKTRHPVDRALRLLQAGLPDRTWEELASLNIGLRDRHLLSIRQRMFGPGMELFANCPSCQENLEFSLDVPTLLAGDSEGNLGREPSLEMVLDTEGYEIHYRLPNSWDLAAAAGNVDIDAARQTIVARCVLAVRREIEEVSLVDLPKTAVTALAVDMESKDPLAEILIDLTCPACEHKWSTIFDILSFLWTEITQRARRLMGDVHVLARHYGWREADILGLTDQRRQVYLDLVVR